MIDRENAILLKFEERYGTCKGVGLARAPGRVNIIGEHTDYNEGYVLPIAIGQNTLVAFRPNGSRMVNAYSMTKEEATGFSLDERKTDAIPHWASYVAGVAYALQDADVHPVGADIVIHTTLPVGGGLSSSAALEVSCGLAFTSAAGIELDKKKLALVCQAAENTYVGMQCGIMDQYVALFAHKGAAVRIDCRSLEHELVPLSMSGAKFVVCDTGVRHTLASSEYNNRRRECEQGARLAAQVLCGEPIRTLRDLAADDLPELQAPLDPVVFKRVRHVVTENARVVEATKAMKMENYIELGVMMDASHESLRDDYEVSCKELDTMVEIAWSQPGVYGSRMTGGGFGGCTITLIDTAHVDAFCERMAQAYKTATGTTPSMTVCSPESAAEVIRAAS